MPLFGRRPQDRAGRTLPPATRSLTPIAAAGQRIDLSQPQPNMVRRREWQDAAWGYRDTVPELRFATGFIANSLGRLRVYAALNMPRGQEPVPLTRDPVDESGIDLSVRSAAIDAVERLDLDGRGASLLARLGENLEVAAEAYLLGQASTDTPSGEDWSVRSVTEVKQDATGKITLVEPGGRPGGGGIELDPAQCELLRIWRPHPQFYEWPDSELAACLDLLEELRLIDRQSRASVRSRISSGQILYIPQELSLSRAGGAPVSAAVPATEEDEDPFMAELGAAMLEPIASEDDPSAVVPIVIRGPSMIGDKPAKDLIATIAIPRDDPAEGIAKRAAKVQALARALNIPAEILTGLGDANHWTGWLLSADTVRNHIEPRAEVLCDSLAVAYLRPALRAMGVDPAVAGRVCLWFDASELVQSPNRGQDALDAHNAEVISDAALRKAKGFGDEDAPSEVELLRRALSKGRLTPNAIPLILDAIEGRVPTAAAIARAAGIAPVVNVPEPPGGAPPMPPARPAPTPAQPTANEPTRSGPPAQVASARRPEPVWRVSERDCARLGQLDAQLVERLTAHADATVGRAVERAANRIRARAVRSPELAAAFKGRPAALVVAELGARAFDYQDQTDLDDATAGMQQEWNDTTAAAAETIAAVVAAMLGVEASRQLVVTLTAGARQAWAWLDSALRRTAQRVLYGQPEPQVSGEQRRGPMPPAVIRGALALAGGLPDTSPGLDDVGGQRGPGAQPLGGMATGQTVTAHLAERGGSSLGYEWQYFGIERNRFTPHERLGGRRFGSWSDEVLRARPEDEAWIGEFYVPGDHPGCLCGFYPIYAVPADPSEARVLADISALAERPSQVESRILLAEVDDAEGRTGTTAQRARDAHAELVRLRLAHIGSRETP